MNTLCFPAWHTTFAPLVNGPADAILHSGCGVNSVGNVNCAPETMRANAEQQLQASGYWPSGKPLTLDAYALARNIQSEVGASTPEMRVALAESSRNQAALRGVTPARLVLTSNSGLFGTVGGGSGRFTSSSQDPSVLAVLIADFVLSGGSNNFAQGADDQDGLEYGKPFNFDPAARIQQYANNDKMYWVGPLPGVDHWTLTLFRKYGHAPNSPEGQALLQRALTTFANPEYDFSKNPKGIILNKFRPVWTGLEVCGSSSPGVDPDFVDPVVVPSKPTRRPTQQPGYPRPPTHPATKPRTTVVQLPAISSPIRNVLIGFAAMAGFSAIGLFVFRMSTQTPVRVVRRRAS